MEVIVPCYAVYTPHPSYHAPDELRSRHLLGMGNIPKHQLIPNPEPSTDSGVLYSASEMTSPASAFSPGGPSENGAASQTLPSNQNYEGEHTFTISLGQPTQQAAKSISWTYSSQLHKLFVDRDRPCPIHFKTSSAPPAGCVIRALPIFKKSESIQEVVKRCPNHVGENEDEKHHLIMCSDPEAAYSEDPTTGRFSVTVPYRMPQVGADSVQFLFTFKCFQSCVGGLNRRPIQTVFTLENEGKILGRQVLDVRICACPGRDRKAEEKSKSEKKKGTKRGTSKITQEVSITSLTKKRKVDKEIYTITVEGREKYEVLMKIKQGLDLMEYVTPEQLKSYKEHESQLAKTHPRLNSTPSSSQSQPTNSQSNQQHIQQQSLHPPQMATNGLHNHTPHPVSIHQAQQQAQINDESFSALLNQPSQSFLAQQQMYANHNIVNTSLAQQQNYTQLQPINALSRSDTIPVLPQGHMSLAAFINDHRSRDQPDGPMEVDQQVTSSQGFPISPPTSNHIVPPSSQNLHAPPSNNTLQGGSQITSTTEHSLESWLQSIGCLHHRDSFRDRGINTINDLDELQYPDDIGNMGIPQTDRETLWKALIERRSTKRSSSTPSMIRNASNASTISIQSSGGSGQTSCFRATRYTLKQTVTLKVEKEDD